MSEEIGGDPVTSERAVAYCRRVVTGTQEYRDWIEVFGEAPVPLVYPTPVPGSAPGRPDAYFYLIAFDGLAEPTQKALVDMIARRWGLGHEEIRERIAQDGGVPALAENLIVVS